MLDAPAALKSYMAARSRNVFAVDLLTLSLPGAASPLRYTHGDVAVSATASQFPASSPLNGSGGPFTFALGPPFDRVKFPKREIGIKSAECPITLYPRSVDLIGSYAWQQYAFALQFDGATVEVDRFHWSGDGSLSPLGAFISFYGRVAEIELGRTSITLHAKTLPYLLETQPMPRDVYQAACNYAFGGTLCQHNRTVALTSFACGTGSTGSALTGSGLGTTSAYNNAVCLGLTGANAGKVALVSSIASGTVNLVTQAPNAGFPNTPSSGDTFQLGSAAAITAGAGSTQAAIVTSFSSSLAYSQGTIIGTSGANNGVSRTVSLFSGGVVTVTRNFPFPVATGDGFKLMGGCSRAITGCQGWANLIRFGGFPYIPPPEQSL